MELKECKIGTPVVIGIDRGNLQKLDYGHIVGFTYNVREEHMSSLSDQEKLQYVIVLVRLPNGKEEPFHPDYLTRM